VGYQKRKSAYARGYRSGLESKIADQLKGLGIDPQYETMKIAFTQPEKKRKYTPDFILPNGIIIESKGRLMPEDRAKHCMIQEQHPELDIRFVFTNPNATISKTSKTTYAMWCEKNGFKYAKGLIPEAWINEPRRSL